MDLVSEINVYICYVFYDAALRICGVDCLLSADWKSPNKIIARTGQVKGRGDIIVVTRSGGVGSCTVQFKGYFIHIGLPIYWFNIIKVLHLF